MTHQNAAHFYNEIKQAHANQERQKALKDPESFVKLAADRGYSLEVDKLQNQLDHLSDEEVAAIFNPGIGPRQHLFPR